MSFSSEGQFSQCVRVNGNTRYFFGIKYKQPDDFNVFCSFTTYASTDCSGAGEPAAPRS